MATLTITKLISDLSGDEAAETVTFGIDGRMYELDVTSREAATLRAALKGYADAARPMGRGAAPARPKPATRHQGRKDAQQVREWARSQGMPVSDKGRVAAAIQEQYDNRDRGVPELVLPADLDEDKPKPSADPFTMPDVEQVTDKMVREWCKAKGLPTVGRKRTELRDLYSANNSHSFVFVDITKQEKAS